MTLENLTKEQIEEILESLKINPHYWTPLRNETINWVRLQYNEQTEGGAWKRRIREQGHVI
jgi:hypothetical protein